PLSLCPSVRLSLSPLSVCPSDPLTLCPSVPDPLSPSVSPQKLEGSKSRGQLLIFGATNWDLIGRKEVPKQQAAYRNLGQNLWGPHRYGGLAGLRVRSVVSGPCAAHSLLISAEGRLWSWGRNEKGQLGHGDTKRVEAPKLIEVLASEAIVAAACGRNHTLALTRTHCSHCSHCVPTVPIMIPLCSHCSRPRCSRSRCVPALFPFCSRCSQSRCSRCSQSRCSRSRCSRCSRSVPILFPLFPIPLFPIPLFPIPLFPLFPLCSHSVPTVPIVPALFPFRSHCSRPHCSRSRCVPTVFPLFPIPLCSRCVPAVPDPAVPAVPGICSQIMYNGQPITKLGCGAEFSMVLDCKGNLYSFGCPEYGQLGHSSDGKFIARAQRIEYDCELVPRRVGIFVERTKDGQVLPVPNVVVRDVACGANHTLVLDSQKRVFSWGFGGYGRLGHAEQKDELVPRLVKLFDFPGRGASQIYAGYTCSFAVSETGGLFFWGATNTSRESTMYPKAVQDLCGWRIRSLACG
ncbi:PREDICTED: protein RCC2, partial [Corvus brachyrhynchos]|uniref:protein RCC2 n=1 Tax=Corvus brachyrhynchos TaxID=85066 RepID=UPI0008165DBD